MGLVTHTTLCLMTNSDTIRGNPGIWMWSVVSHTYIYIYIHMYVCVYMYMYVCVQPVATLLEQSGGCNGSCYCRCVTVFASWVRLLRYIHTLAPTYGTQPESLRLLRSCSCTRLQSFQFIAVFVSVSIPLILTDRADDREETTHRMILVRKR